MEVFVAVRGYSIIKRMVALTNSLIIYYVIHHRAARQLRGLLYKHRGKNAEIRTMEQYAAQVENYTIYYKVKELIPHVKEIKSNYVMVFTKNSTSFVDKRPTLANF